MVQYGRTFQCAMCTMKTIITRRNYTDTIRKIVAISTISIINDSRSQFGNKWSQFIVLLSIHSHNFNIVLQLSKSSSTAHIFHNPYDNQINIYSSAARKKYIWLLLSTRVIVQHTITHPYVDYDLDDKEVLMTI